MPIRVGQEFSGYAASLLKAARGIERASESLKDLGIGGSAAGTGINTHPEYAGKVVEKLRKTTNLDLKESKIGLSPCKVMRRLWNSQAPSVHCL